MRIKAGYSFVNGDYVFSTVAKEVKNFKQEAPNVEVIDLGVGDVKLPPPESVCRAIIQSSEQFITPQGFCGYPPEEGIEDLRKAISEYYKKHGAEVFCDEIFITTGAKPALGELFEICNFRRASIIIPTYPIYEELCALHGVAVDFCLANEKNSYPLPQKKADVAFYCSPNNPMGYALSKKQLVKICADSLQNNYLAVIDGAYADFSEDYIPPYKFKNCANVIEVRSYSKNLCFTGLRLGYMVIKRDNPIYSAYKKYLSIRSNGVNVIMQRSAICAYSIECVKEQKKRVEYYRQNASILAKPFLDARLKVMGGKNAPYLIIEVKENGHDFFKKALYGCAVVVTPGEAFRANNCIRISCLCSEENATEGAKRLDEFLKNY